ncbi:MAG TPA: BLUF domain-containing protein [Paracoccaceae bacterium]|nr:BLUF domain-containing protein [Paracoccaceae bacterium]
MYHGGLFFQGVEAQHSSITDCFARIGRVRRHSGVSLMWEGKADGRSFPGWAMGYAGPSEIGIDSGHRPAYLPDLKTGKDTPKHSDSIAVQFASDVCQSFSGVDRFGPSLSRMTLPTTSITAVRRCSRPTGARGFFVIRGELTPAQGHIRADMPTPGGYDPGSDPGHGGPAERVESRSAQPGCPTPLPI